MPTEAMSSGERLEEPSRPSTIQAVGLDQIQDNPFNSRLFFDEGEVQRLANSIDQLGLLQPVKVRKNGPFYELVYGHRRVRAARLLGWNKIPAEVDRLSDEELLVHSLAENMKRQDLTDYEIGLSFSSLHKKFSKTYDEIGALAGCSKQHVSNMVAMTRLLNEEELRRDPELGSLLLAISEHHARLLSRIDNQVGRVKALRLVVSEGMSVRDLERALQKLGGWFDSEDAGTGGKASASVPNQEGDDLSQIRRSLQLEYELPHNGDFQHFSHFHSFNEDFSLVPSYTSGKLYEGRDAYFQEKNWFYSVGPKVSARIREMKVRFFGDVALATLVVSYSGNGVAGTRFGTVVFVKRRGWRIVHEHWSRMSCSKKTLVRWREQSMRGHTSPDSPRSTWIPSKLGRRSDSTF